MKNNNFAILTISELLVDMLTHFMMNTDFIPHSADKG